MQLLDHLRKREAAGKPIRVGLVGCGQEGSGMVHVTHKMAGMETCAIADLDVNRPLKTLAGVGRAGKRDLHHQSTSARLRMRCGAAATSSPKTRCC